MQKTDHSQFTSFVLSEFEQITKPKKPGYKTYFIWVGCFLIPIIGLILGVINGGELDRQITLSLYNLFDSVGFFKNLGNLFQYSYFVFLGGAMGCLIIVILYLIPKTKEKVVSASKYAVLYLLVMSLSFIDHIILQMIVNRTSFDPILSSTHPFFLANPSFTGVWASSFPNNNLVLSGVIILLPVLFGNRSGVFKWIIGVISGILILFISFSEIGSGAWFTDVFASIGLVLFWSWLLYWHVLFVKEVENIVKYDKLTKKYYKAHEKLVLSKEAFDSGDLDKCKKLLDTTRELYNQSISSIQNLPGNISPYIDKNKYWKFNVSLLVKEIENGEPPSRKWLYIF